MHVLSERSVSDSVKAHGGLSEGVLHPPRARASRRVGDRRQETGDRRFLVALRPKTLTSADRRFWVRTDLSVRTSDLAVEADLSHRYARATAESR